MLAYFTTHPTQLQHGVGVGTGGDNKQGCAAAANPSTEYLEKNTMFQEGCKVR